MKKNMLTTKIYAIILCIALSGIFNQADAQWSLSGNAITTSNWLGGTAANTNPLIIKTNGTERMRLLGTNGYVGIGVTSPTSKLEVYGPGSNNTLTESTLEVTHFGNAMYVDGNSIDSKFNNLFINYNSGKSIQMVGGTSGAVYVGSSTNSSGVKLQITGGDNNGTSAALKISSGSQDMLLDGNEIDGITDDIYLNHNTNKNVFLATGGGNVGIDIVSTSAKLHVGSGADANLGNYDAGYFMLGLPDGKNVIFDNNEIMARDWTNVSDGAVNSATLFLQAEGGRVSINTTASTPGFSLEVGGKIRAEEIVVETGWSDFVFEENYKLRSLSEVETFIKENGHLPEIPSAKEVEKNGVTLGEMESKLLMKIEELTLYLIDMKKQNDELLNRLANVEQKSEKENTK